MTSSAEERRARLPWWANPWLLLVLMFGGGPLAWIGLGVWQERQETLAVAELEVRGNKASAWTFRSPRWIPKWLYDSLPDGSRKSVTSALFMRLSKPLSERDLWLLQRAPDLKRIDIDDASAISDAAFSEFLQHKALRRLCFGKPYRLTVADVAALARNEYLDDLIGLAGPFDDVVLHELATIRKLDWLELDGRVDGVRALTGLAAMPHLQRLHLRHSGLTDTQFALLATNRNLTELALGQTQLTAASWPLLDGMPLENVSLESPHVSDETARIVSRMPHVSSVTLLGGQLTDEGVRLLCDIPELSELQLDSNALTSVTLSHLRANEFLTALRLHGPVVDDVWAAELARLGLYHLTLVDTQITDAGCAKFASLHSVTRLALPGSRITDESISTFNSLGWLGFLDLRNTAFSDAGLRRLNCRELQALHLGGTQVTLAAARAYQVTHPSVELLGIEGLPAQYTPWDSRFVELPESEPAPQ